MLGIVNLSLLSQWLTNVSASPRLFASPKHHLVFHLLG